MTFKTSNVTLLSLPEYENIAKRLTAKLIRPSIKKRLNADDEWTTDAVSALITADCQYDDSKGTKLETYRTLHFLWAFGNRYKKLKRESPLNANGELVNIPITKIESCHDNTNIAPYNHIDSPLDICIKNEEKIEVLNLIQKAKLTPKQEQCLKMYYFDGLTHEKIGEAMGFTKERSRQYIISSLEKLRKAAI